MWSRLLAPVLFLSVCLVPARGEESTDVFNGAWNVTFTPDNAAEQSGATEFKDATLFRGEQLSAAAFAMYGFNTVPYTLTGDTQNIFTASMTSDTAGTLQWVGRRESGQVVGILVWTKADGSTHKYSFKGVPYQE